MNALSPGELAARLSTPNDSTLLDVRKAAALHSAGRTLPGALWRDPALWLEWKDSVASDKPVVVYCAHGQEISQALAMALQVMGRDVAYLRGGYGAWVEAGLATQAIA
ncbi:MAG: rhodanese-like domain-containing protein [Hydrogenophaga sp.]